MVIPGSHDEVAVFRHHLQDIRKFARIEAVTVGYRAVRFEPNLGIAAPALDVNVLGGLTSPPCGLRAARIKLPADV
jgi:hypothetical protein